MEYTKDMRFPVKEEFEITDLNRIYFEDKTLNVKIFNQEFISENMKALLRI